MAYDVLKCLQCDFSCKQEIRFLDHLTDVHDISDHEQHYADVVLNGKKVTCACSPDCSELIPWAGWKKGYKSKYARGHNARVDSSFGDPEITKMIAEKRKEGYRTGKYKVWNDGLTKETSPKIAQISEKISSTLNEGYESGRIVDWRINDPEKALAVAKKSSETKKRKFASGETVNWTQGKTKETDQRIAIAAQKISERYDHPDAGNRIKLGELKERIDVYSDLFTLETPLEEYKKRRVERLQIKCKMCNTVQLKSLAMLEETPKCFNCHPKESVGQLEVYEFVKSLGVEAVLSDRTQIKPFELDVFVPSRKLAIEYNGLYWHSSRFRDTSYHTEKMEACQRAGISFLAIYEDEWRDKRCLVGSMIKHRLGIVSTVHDARKLNIIELDKNSARIFFDDNHLEGYARSVVSFGLTDNTGTVVAAMALRKPFHKKHLGWTEVSRCCVRSSYNVRGWLGRLSQHALGWAKEHGARGLMTYVDARVGVGSGYASAGWTCVKHNTGPRFWWTDFVNRYNRFKFKADKSRGMTQAQIAATAGVVIIYGCSNSMWNMVAK